MKPYVIVLGNEKGGTGKSTVAMHVAVYLLNEGFKVGTIDVDARQGTFTRYLDNRKKHNESLPRPEHIALFRSADESIKTSNEKDQSLVNETMQKLSNCDFIVADTPGNDTVLSQAVHTYADTLITPMNESFIDLDVLVRVEKNDPKTMHPSIYAEMVWNQRKARAIRRQKPIDWIVIKNRLANLYSKNRKDIDLVLDVLSKRIGFRVGNGFCERVIFKELFLSGLTVLDLEAKGAELSLSHIAARQELRDLINFMNLPLEEHKSRQ